MIIEEILKYVPAEKVGLRLSPRGYRPGLADSDSTLVYSHIINRLNDYNLAYLHLSEMMSPEDRLDNPEKSFVRFYRQIYNGTLLSCGGHSRESGERMLANHEADLIVFGRPFISNPDLVKRLRVGAPLTEPDKETFYHGGPKGYTDYPFMT